MRSKPKLEVNSRRFSENITISSYKCVESCKNGYVESLNRCYKTNSNNADLITFNWSKLLGDLVVSWPQIFCICIIAGLLTFSILLLFRFGDVEVMIWVVCLGPPAIIILISIIFLFMGQIIAAMIFLFPAILAIIFVFWFRHRIILIAALFKETSKALIDIPTILLEPILTFVAQMIAIALALYFGIVIETAGDPELKHHPDNTSYVSYELNAGAIIAKYTNGIAFIWFSFFISGCQTFIIAGERIYVKIIK